MIISFQGLSKESKDREFVCDFHWKTLAENISIKERTVVKSLTQKINSELTAIVEINKSSSALTVTEFYKDNRYYDE